LKESLTVSKQIIPTLNLTPLQRRVRDTVEQLKNAAGSAALAGGMSAAVASAAKAIDLQVMRRLAKRAAGASPAKLALYASLAAGIALATFVARSRGGKKATAKAGDDAAPAAAKKRAPAASKSATAKAARTTTTRGKEAAGKTAAADKEGKRAPDRAIRKNGGATAARASKRTAAR
jgi:hypothetical protein